MSSIKDFILLIPCYNNLTGLFRSIKSIQYPPDKFEILIVDDGSALPISIDSLPAKVTIQILRISQNQGVVNALNTGLEVLRERTDYKYIARLDAGDTCHPERFTKQINFLNAHTDIFLLGSWCRFEDSKTGKGYNYITKTSHEDVLKQMHFKCSFIHPTVIFKKEVLETIGYYPTDFPHAEDYAYFWRIMNHHKTSILSENLVTIELSGETVSSKNYRKQILTRKKIVGKFGTIQLLQFIGSLLLLLRMLMPKTLIGRIKELH